uniref:DNA-directed RNA polymerase subunit beta n=2 Tax=Picocystis salinarum TaxID=88271 RepID=A0A088CIE5_9CHLO|nr:beta subunit of RNA polymerase [Picocystis salinarum]AID67638.1 beta subunit of RNA polymerase [Picocystis salinarum]
MMIPPLPWFVKLQLSSFRSFLRQGLLEELCYLYPTLSADDIRWKWPKRSPQECVLENLTYCTSFYVCIENQWIWLGDLPLMTSRGHFIWNGSARVVVHQIVRSPGIYFKEIRDAKNRRTVVGNIICARGSWLRLEMDKQDRIWVKWNQGKKVLVSTFLQDLERYDLGSIGRIQLNRKLKLSIPAHVHNLQPEDIVAATDALINLTTGEGAFDDIDHLKNRRIKASGELLQNQFRIGCLRLERMLQDQGKINPKTISGALREFFGSSPLSQLMDQTNPLAEITHKRRLTCLGPGGLSKERAGMAVREIHPSHYGRICPIETPEGPNAGLVGSLASFAMTNRFGNLIAPFYKIRNGKASSTPQFLLSEDEEKSRVSPGDIVLSKNRMLPNDLISIRVEQEWKSVPSSSIDFIGIAPMQTMSIATALIPFVEHDDANRALMGSNMQRQAVPLIKPEPPIVGTGLEAQVGQSSTIYAPKSGKVVYVSSEKIRILSEALDESLMINLQRSNQGTWQVNRPTVFSGEWVEVGECIADGPSTVQGDLALGKNIVVAYMPWEGFNFEDAICVSERLIYHDVFTSVHIANYETKLRQTESGLEKITKDLPGVSAYFTRHLDNRGIARVGSWVKEGDILVGKVTPREVLSVSPQQRLLLAIFRKEAPSNFKESALRVPHGVQGRIIRVIVGSTIQVWIAQQRKLQVGDKLAGRHGNKGIVSKIMPRQDMPYLPNGVPVDMVLNPLGVPSRMNVGQIFECLLGFAGDFLDERYQINSFDEKYGPEASRGLVYSKLFEAKNKTGQRWILNSNYPGKTNLFDGRTGELMDQPVTVGKAYILKLVHLVEDKMHARSTGPYSLVTQQPLGGRSKHGGQRVGEMEVWALEGFGAAYCLQELLTVKSDDMKGRNEVMNAILKGSPVSHHGTPEAFKVLVRELQALCFEIGVYQGANRPTRVHPTVGIMNMT